MYYVVYTANDDVQEWTYIQDEESGRPAKFDSDKAIATAKDIVSDDLGGCLWCAVAFDPETGDRYVFYTSDDGEAEQADDPPMSFGECAWPEALVAPLIPYKLTVTVEGVQLKDILNEIVRTYHRIIEGNTGAISTNDLNPDEPRHSFDLTFSVPIAVYIRELEEARVSNKQENLFEEEKPVRTVYIVKTVFDDECAYLKEIRKCQDIIGVFETEEDALSACVLNGGKMENLIRKEGRAVVESVFDNWEYHIIPVKMGVAREMFD